MSRSRLSLAAALTALVLSGCTVAPEEPILDQFFIHSRLRDTTALSAFSSVILEPTTQGIVTTFHIVRVTITARDPEGGAAGKEVTLNAPVELPDGRIVDKTLVVGMERRESGWKISSVQLK
jgi:hypothetical protein